MDVRITGADQLRKLAAHIKATGDKGLGRQMAAAMEKAVRPISSAITASAAATMPSGYRGALTRSLKHRRSTRTATRQASVRLATYAPGVAERRDLPALETGRLRHPVFGRSRPLKAGGRKANPWATTTIRPGFHRRGTEQAGPAAETALLQVLDDFTNRLAKG